jgi:hypothetical protein
MNDVSLREYMESQVRALDRHVDLQIAAIKDATAAALKTIPTKEDIDRRLNALEKNQSYAAGRSALFGAFGGVAVSLLGLIIAYMVKG